jgi:cysteine desulfurase/selenocysteine lyase
MHPNRRQFLSACAVGAVLPGCALDATQRPTEPSVWPSSFPALTRDIRGQRLAYLDSAATTLRPQSVIDALVDYYSTDNANPSPVHTLASRAAQRLADARREVARFINAPDASEVVFTRGTTEGVNLVATSWGAANLRTGDEIILTIAEHSSNLMPWTRAAQQAQATVRIVDVDEEGRLRLDQLQTMLSSRTRLVAFSHVSNVLGLVNPAKTICALAEPPARVW